MSARIRRAVGCGCAVLLTAAALATHGGIVLFRLADPASVHASARLQEDGTLELALVVSDMPDWFVGAEDRALAILSVTDDRGTALEVVADRDVVQRNLARGTTERSFLAHVDRYIHTYRAPDRRATALIVRGERSWNRSRNTRTFEATCPIER